VPAKNKIRFTSPPVPLCPKPILLASQKLLEQEGIFIPHFDNNAASFLPDTTREQQGGQYGYYTAGFQYAFCQSGRSKWL